MAESETGSDTPKPSIPGGSIPGLPENWDQLAVSKIVDTVDQVKVRTSGPAVRMSRSLVFGLLGGLISLVAVIISLIGIVRLLDNILPYEVWFVYLILGAIFLILGATLWSMRPKGTAD